MDTIIRVRLTCDRGTQDYVQRRTAEGKSRREVRRSLKRYLARQLFWQLNTVMA